MKLLTFAYQTPLGLFSRLGLLFQDHWVIDLNAAYAWFLSESESRPQPQRWADFLFPGNMRAFLEMGKPAMEAARQVESHIGHRAFSTTPSSENSEMAGFSSGEAASHRKSAGNAKQSSDYRHWQGLNGARLLFNLNEIILQTPVTQPRMLRDFLAFETHTANGFKKRQEPIPDAWYKMPVYYKGNPNTLVGHETPIHWPFYTRKLDYELELACIIGKEGQNISVEDAPAYIAGYTILNDFSARDIQKDEMMCRLGPAKGKDFASALGPWLVTADSIPDPRNLRMTAKINGELWSDGNSGTSYWTFEQMIAHVSMEETVYPGDILGSGTVGFGCGLELDRWLKEGDEVELEIENLGILRNRVGCPLP